MKKTKIILSMILIPCLMLVFSGCSIIKKFIPDAADLYDNNKKIASGLNSFEISDAQQSKDEHSFTASIGKMSGMDTVWEYESNADENIDINCTLEVISGKAKLVLISPDSTVTVLIEGDNDSNTTEYKTDSLPIKEGNNRIKLVALNDTKLDINLEISSGEFYKLGLADDFMK